VPRHGSDVLEVAVGGVRRPVRGRVCMDQVVVGLGGDLPDAGEEVVIFGPGTHGEPTAQDWAEACGTISYEIVTRIGGRFRPRFVDTGRGRPGPRAARSSVPPRARSDSLLRARRSASPVSAGPSTTARS